MSLPRFYSYPYFTGALMIRLGRDVFTLSDGLSAFCFMGVSSFGFGGLAATVALVLGISTGTDAPSSLPSEEARAVGGVGGISRNWLDMDPVSGILCSGCIVFNGVRSLSVH